MKANFCRIFTIIHSWKNGLCDTYENLLEIAIPLFTTVIAMEYY